MKRFTAFLFAVVLGVGALAAPSEAAFSQRNLTKLTSGSDTRPTVFSYEESATIATISAANYMADSSQQRLEAGDLILISGSDGTALYSVVSASTTANVLKRFTGVDTLQATVTWDPGSIVTGSGETKSVTVTGAALGDFCVAACPLDLVDMNLTCYVQATDTVEMRLNNSAANADVASSVCKVRVFK